MIRADGRFADQALERAFRADIHDRNFWVVIGPWLAGTFIVAFSIVQAYLRLGVNPEFLAVAAIRVLLIFAIVCAFVFSRRSLEGRAYQASALAVLIGLVLFNVTAVVSGASDWDRIARATIIELFLIGLSLMTLPREALIGLLTVWLCHMGMGVVGYATGPVSFLNNLLLVTLAGVVSGVIVWRFSLSERHAFLNRRELEQARAAAEKSNQAKARFLANMSHEIRTPMTGVLGMLDVALDAELAEPQRQQIQDARNSANSLLSILNDVLDFSKIESEGITLSEGDFDPREMMEQVETMFRSRATEKGIDLRLDAADLPASLHADSSRLRQVVVNLAGNAVKFTSHGAVQLVARWVEDRDTPQNPAQNASGVLHIEVSDDGIGISKSNQAKLFERFTQADASTTRRFGGTGLGLSISKEIIETMRGRIGVNSTEGSGSTFWFEVPCRQATSAVATEPTCSDVTTEQPLKLLVAEDSPVNQKIVSAFLKKAGHELVLVDDGEAAVEQVQQEHFDLVLMDMQMPKLDGVGAAHAIRALDGPAARLPIIALTAESMQGDRERLLASGMDGYVSKPIDRKFLIATIAQVYRERSMSNWGRTEVL